MNPIYLCTAPLVLLFCATLFAWILSGQRLSTLCPSAGDLLVLPFVGLYLLMLLATGWLCCCFEFLAPRSGRGFREHQTAPQLSRRPHDSMT